MVDLHTPAPETPPATASIYARPIPAAMRSVIEAFKVPACILDRDGFVLAANAAWAEICESQTLDCPVGDSYLDWCAGMDDEIAGGLLGRGARQVLCGRQASHEQTWRRPALHASAKIRVQRIERQAPGLFLLSYEPAGPTDAEDVEDRVATAQFQERERFAAELHDSVGQNLVCLGLGLTRLRRLSVETGEIATVIKEMGEALDQAHAEVRTLSFLLQPPWLEEPGAFQKAIRNLVVGFARRAGLEASLDMTTRPLNDLARTSQLTLFRVLQEALVNVHRHAHADAVQVEMIRRTHDVVLRIRDNGRGITAPEGNVASMGVGIASMRARLRKLGGDLKIVSGRDGTAVTAKLPC